MARGRFPEEAEGPGAAQEGAVTTAVQGAVIAVSQPVAEVAELLGYAVVEEPTAPRPRDASGRELDQWGLPRSGPARVDALGQLGKEDPITHPQDWQE